MANYKQLYFNLFAAVADAIEAMDRLDFNTAREILIQAEQAAEEQYLSAEER